MVRAPVHARRARSWSTRTVGTRDLIPSFLIVCEGEKTEPNYFRRFRVPAEVARIDVQGIGANTVSLVRKAIALRDAGDYDQTWCVFDRDSFSLARARPRPRPQGAASQARMSAISRA